MHDDKSMGCDTRTDLMLRVRPKMPRVISVGYVRRSQQTPFVPAEAGTQTLAKELGPRFRGDERGEISCTSQAFELTHRVIGQAPSR